MAKRDVVVLNEQASRLEVAQAGDTYNMPRSLDVQGNVNATGNVSANSVSVGGVAANAGEVAAQALRLPGGTVTAPSQISGQTLAASIANGAEADLAVAGQPRFALTNGNRTLFAVDQVKGLAGMLGNIADPLVWLPLRRPEEITGTQAAAGARYSGQATFTRASTATYIDPLDGLLKTAAINTPRFERMADGGIGLLIEGSSTNLVLQSEALDAADWIKANTTVTANAAVAPDGNTTADKLVEGAVSGGHYIYQLVSVTGGNTYTLSVYAKAAERTVLSISPYDGVSSYVADFDLANGTITVIAGNPTAKITQLANGWYRCELTFTVDPAATTLTAEFVVRQVVGGGPYLGDGTSGIYLWGAQLEQLPFASSYIPTATAQVTRAGDRLYIPAAGNRPDDGSATGQMTLIADVEIRGAGAIYQDIFRWNNGSTYRILAMDTATGAFRCHHGPTPREAGSINYGTRQRVAVRTDGALMSLWVDGVKVGEWPEEALTADAATTVGVGCYPNGDTEQLWGIIANARIYDRALTDAEMSAA